MDLEVFLIYVRKFYTVEFYKHLTVYINPIKKTSVIEIIETVGFYEDQTVYIKPY